MKIPVFVSRPAPHLAKQQDFIEKLSVELGNRGFNPLTLGPDASYDYDAPLIGIRRILTHCCGLVSVAFRRTHAEIVTRYPESDVPGRSTEDMSDVWLTSPYCQIEPAMAFQLGLPILILREQGVLAEGVLETGVTGLYLPEFSLSSESSFIKSEMCQRLLDQWAGHVNSTYKSKGDPPKLF